jgi:hypothetical protein
MDVAESGRGLFSSRQSWKNLDGRFSVGILSKALLNVSQLRYCFTNSLGATYKYNSIQFFIIYVPSQQLQGQLETQHSVDTGNCIMDKHNIKSKTN